MSSQNWAEYGFGLVLTGDETEKFVTKVLGEEYDAYDLVEVPEFEGYARYYGSDTEGQCFSPAGKNGKSVENEDMLAFWAERQQDAFKAQYTGDSVVEEFRNRIGKYLPEDFNYIGHIGYFSCCMYV